MLKRKSNQTLKPEKIQKILAQAGIASRRQIEAMIEQGRIKVNGKIAKIGDRATTEDRFMIDTRIVKLQRLLIDKTKVLMYHKPAGEVCTRRDPEGRPTVFEQLPRLRKGRWVNIGRLDINTSGLLLFTNNGELANRLMHPRYYIEREYAVRVLGEVSDEILHQLKNGVQLEDGAAHFEEILDAGGTGANRWYHVILREGRYREVRRLWEAVNIAVSRLIRVRFGSITLPRILKQGKFRDLTDEELKELYQLVEWKE